VALITASTLLRRLTILLCSLEEVSNTLSLLAAAGQAFGAAVEPVGIERIK